MAANPNLLPLDAAWLDDGALTDNEGDPFNIDVNWANRFNTIATQTFLGDDMVNAHANAFKSSMSEAAIAQFQLGNLQVVNDHLKAAERERLKRAFLYRLVFGTLTVANPTNHEYNLHPVQLHGVTPALGRYNGFVTSDARTAELAWDDAVDAYILMYEQFLSNYLDECMTTVGRLIDAQPDKIAVVVPANYVPDMAAMNNGNMQEIRRGVKAQRIEAASAIGGIFYSRNITLRE